MQKRVVQSASLLALAAGMWIVPSVGTRGQGTLGDRFVHVDSDVVGHDAAARSVLRRSDAAIVAAVAGL